MVRVTRSPAVAGIADRTAYGTFINNYVDENIVPCSQQHLNNEMVT